jgi:hypothetical protein
MTALRTLFDEKRRKEIRDALKVGRKIRFKRIMPEAESPKSGMGIIERLETLGGRPKTKEGLLARAIADLYRSQPPSTLVGVELEAQLRAARLTVAKKEVKVGEGETSGPDGSKGGGVTG